MFDFTDEKEEAQRREWYSPIGEYILLFSNLEFELSTWISLLSDSRAIKNAASALHSQFPKKVDVLLDLIDEYMVAPEIKDSWEREWKKAKEMAKMRNIICHNPPIDNFRLSVDSEGNVHVNSRAVELHTLKKPIGAPGSGMSLVELKEGIEKLRLLLVCLDSMHTAEIVRCG